MDVPNDSRIVNMGWKVYKRYAVWNPATGEQGILQAVVMGRAEKTS
jgi:hypothetical protein